MRGNGWSALAGLAALLTGCTTAATGVAVAPPGINRLSFRECLLANGFYSPQALTGIALRDWRYRHAQPDFTKRPAKPEPTRYELLQQSDAAFVGTAARVIAAGLMPSDEFWDDRMNDPGSAAADAVAQHHEDAGRNRPYVEMGAPPPYGAPVQANAAALVAAQQRPSEGDRAGRDWRLNRFLDCYLAPVGVQPAAWNSPDERAAIGEAAQLPDDRAPWALPARGDDDLEGRLLRGHILLALLTQYGTELVVSHPSRRQVAQAELLLGHVKDAETALRNASLIVVGGVPDAASAFLAATDKDGNRLAFSGGRTVLADTHGAAVPGADGKPTPAAMALLTVDPRLIAAQPSLRWFEFATRLLRVFQVGVDVERIDAQQSLDRAGNLIAAFSGSIGGFLPILKDGLAGVATVGKVKIYGEAYLRDARETLAGIRKSTRAPEQGADKGKWTYDAAVVTHDWALWDAEIVRACQVLATVAKKDPASAQCVPAAAAP